MDYKTIVLDKIKPKEEEVKKNKKIVFDTLKKIEESLKKNKIKAQIMPGGSFAKNTWLSKDFDCDVFIRFNKDTYKSEEISDITEKNLPFKNIKRIHGSRDYFQFKEKEIQFEIVPTILETNPNDAKNSTDISPMHIEWIKNKEKNNPSLSDEIRLAKQFFKAQQIYGAESYINGFSGHVIDILVAHYKTFENLIEHAKNWKEKEVIDPNNVYSSKEEVLEKLNKSKIDSPIIIIDPILPTRNAAAALDTDKWKKLKQSAKKFFETKNNDLKLKMFEKKKFNPKKPKKDEEIILIQISQTAGSKDIVGCKILKLFEHIKKQLKLNDFNLIASDWNFVYTKEATIYFIVKKEILSEKVVRIGPPVTEKEHSKKFKEINKDVFEKDKRLYANVKRQYRIASALIKDLLNSDYAKEKIEGYKLL